MSRHVFLWVSGNKLTERLTVTHTKIISDTLYKHARAFNLMKKVILVVNASFFCVNKEEM